jgi:hypothetical protein
MKVVAPFLSHCYSHYPTHSYMYVLGVGSSLCDLQIHDSAAEAGVLKRQCTLKGQIICP